LELYKTLIDYAIETFDGDPATKDAARQFFGYGSNPNPLVFQRQGRYAFDEYYVEEAGSRKQETGISGVAADSPASCRLPPASSKRPGDALNENGIGFIRELLLKHGWTYVRQKSEHDELWRRPGKTFGESAILHTDTPTLHVFSTDAPPFGNSTYSYFKVYAMLEHSGDYSAAAKTLAALGYGDPLTTQDVELPKFVELPPENEHEELDGYEEKHDDCPDSFPEHLLNVPGFVNELTQYINSVAHNDQPVYSFAAALAMQALLCAQNVKDPTGIRSNIYIIVAGRSSSGKDKGREVIKKIFTQLQNTTEYKQGFYEPFKFFFEGAASYPALTNWLSANHGALLWLWDEMGQELPALMSDKTSFLSGIISTIMKLYTSADSVYIPHIKASQNDTRPPIQQPNLVIYGTSENETLFNTFAVKSLTDGLIGRLMIFEGKDKAKRKKQKEQLPIPKNILDTAHWWFKKRAAVINQEIPNPDIVPVTEKAESIFDQFYAVFDQIQHENNNIKDALWGRAIQQARQFALIYACSTSMEEPVIDENAAGWAYELITHLIKRKLHIANRHVADSEFDKQQKEVLRYIEDCKGKCTLTMLYRKFRKLKKRERDDIIENLITTLAIRTTTIREDSKRQNITVYIVNKKQR
jgi:hypothetical protein